MSISCDQCQAARINGIFCHETGCPNVRKTWIEGRGWIRFLECRECGADVEEGEACGCQDQEPPEDNEAYLARWTL